MDDGMEIFRQIEVLEIHVCKNQPHSMCCRVCGRDAITEINGPMVDACLNSGGVAPVGGAIV